MALGERANLVGNHRKAAAFLARARSFDRCVQGEQVGLIRNFADRAGDIGDPAGLALQRAGEFHRLHLAGG
ncbi:MAG: hypothetical protein KY463_13025, partial [Actinobacteria bacterium]|nr:hypothetical protein [Actinomycetota bacterium]